MMKAMRALRNLLFVLLAALLPFHGHAQATATATAPHLSVQLIVPPAQIYPGQHFTAGLYFKLAPGWHVYWSNAGDSGEPPAINWNLPAGVTSGPMQFPAPQRLPLGPLMDFGYQNQVLFPIPITVASSFKPSGPAASLGGKVTWLVCREVCIPGKATLSVDRPALSSPPVTPGTIATDAQLIDQFRNTLPQPLPSADQARFQPTVQGFTLAVQTGRHEQSAEFFPADAGILANAAPQPVQPFGNGFKLTLTKDPGLAATPKQLSGVLVLGNGRAYSIHAMPGALALAAAGSSSSGLLRIVLLAFVGGMILNLMPCVFPVLFLKGLSLVQSSTEERRKLRLHGLVYTLGILVSFWILVALLLALRAAGATLGWGFQFQSPVFVGLMAMLLFFLGLSLAGQFEVGLSLTSAGGSLAQRQGYSGSFFTGILAVVVATPCTAPLMGAAIGYALAQSAFASFVVFTALGLGLAVPYLLLTAQPAWTRLLPRPGAWMDVLKQATALPIFGFVIWLVWIMAETRGATGVAILLASLLLLAVAGWVLGRWPARRVPSLVAMLILLAAIGFCAYGVNSLTTPVSSTTTGSTTGSGWKPWSQSAVDQARAAGNPVFVDFTASWCLSCQVNERVALRTAEVRAAFARKHVALFKADWTTHDDAITQALASLGRSGVPTYVLYPAQPDAQPAILPEVLTPAIVLQSLQTLP